MWTLHFLFYFCPQVQGGQYLVEVEQALTEIFKLLKAEQYLVEVEQALTIFVRACFTSTKY
jgi:hypothetical protein